MSVGDVDLQATAQGAAVLLEGGPEEAWAQGDAVTDALLDGTSTKGIWVVDVGRAEEFEGTGGAASFTHVGALKQAATGVHQRRVDGGHVGRGHHPRETGVAKVHVAAVAGHGDDLEVDVDAVVVDEEAAQLAHGHAMAVGQRVLTDERLECVLHQVALDDVPADGVGAVEHHGFDASLGTRPQREADGVAEGVVAAANVLQVAHQHVDTVEVGGVHVQ